MYKLELRKVAFLDHIKLQILCAKYMFIKYFMTLLIQGVVNAAKKTISILWLSMLDLL